MLVNVNRTTIRAEVIYTCNSGFLPQQEMVSICNGSGLWEPPPEKLRCTELSSTFEFVVRILLFGSFLYLI